MTFILEVLFFLNNLGLLFHLMSGIDTNKVPKVLIVQLIIGIVLLVLVTIL